MNRSNCETAPCWSMPRLKNSLVGTLAAASFCAALPSADAQAATLAILDSGGIVTPHVDPKLNYNAMDGSADITDLQKDRHGTDMLGVIERQLSTTVLKYVCKTDCRIMVVKIGNDEMHPVHLTNGLNYARTHGASVVLMALRSPAGQELIPELKAEIAATIISNIPIVVAGGNQGSDDPNQNPLAYSTQPYTISVAAVDESGKIRPDSNRGKLAIAVPAVSTSEASTKLAAIILGQKRKKPDETPAEIRDNLIRSCDVTPDLPIDTKCIVKSALTAPLSVPRSLSETKQPIKTLTIKKKGFGRLLIKGVKKDVECVPKCSFKFRNHTLVKITAIAPDEETRVNLPKRCRDRKVTSSRNTGNRKVVCSLPTSGSKPVVVSFTRR